MTPQQAYDHALSLKTYADRFRAFKAFRDLTDQWNKDNYAKCHRLSKWEYGGIFHDTRGASYYATQWAEKAERHEAVIGDATKHTYLPEELQRQFEKWDALFVESGRQALELIGENRCCTGGTSMNIIVEKCLKNCHTTGLDSLVIKDAPGMVRMFIAKPSHDLYQNNVDSNGGKFSVALHRHHCDVTLMPIMGDVYNVTVSERGKPKKLRSFRYQSPISYGEGKFVPVDETELPINLSSDLISVPTLLHADLLHTIYFPYGQPAAWLVFEGGENKNYNPIVYSNADLANFDFAGLDQPMTEEEVKYALRSVGVRW